MKQTARNWSLSLDYAWLYHMCYIVELHFIGDIMLSYYL
jgi:hypothetical protein